MLVVTLFRSSASTHFIRIKSAPLQESISAQFHAFTSARIRASCMQLSPLPLHIDITPLRSRVAPLTVHFFDAALMNVTTILTLGGDTWWPRG